jgi:hypothetical protein
MPAFQSDAVRTNKANLEQPGWDPGANGAKQTQFPVAGIPHHSTIPPFQRSNPMPIVRNKANSSQSDTNGK